MATLKTHVMTIGQQKYMFVINRSVLNVHVYIYMYKNIVQRYDYEMNLMLTMNNKNI